MNWDRDDICILYPADDDDTDSMAGSNGIDHDGASGVSHGEAAPLATARTNLGRMKLTGAYKLEGIMTCPNQRSFQRTLPYVMVSGSNLLEYSGIKPPPDHAKGDDFFTSIKLDLWRKGLSVNAFTIQTETVGTPQTTVSSSTSTLSLHDINDFAPTSPVADMQTSTKGTDALRSNMPGRVMPQSPSASPIMNAQDNNQVDVPVSAHDFDGPVLEEKDRGYTDSFNDSVSLQTWDLPGQEELEEILEDESYLNEVSRKARQAVRRIKRQIQDSKDQEEKDSQAWELVIQDTPTTTVYQVASLDTLSTAFGRVYNSYKALRSHTDHQDLPSPISKAMCVLEDLQDLVEKLKRIAHGSDAQTTHRYEKRCEPQGLSALLDRLNRERKAVVAHNKHARTAQNPASQATSDSMLAPKPHRFGALQHSVMTMEALLDALDARYFQHCALAYESHDTALTILTVGDFLEETGADGTLMRQFDMIRNDMEIHHIILNRALSQMPHGITQKYEQAALEELGSWIVRGCGTNSGSDTTDRSMRDEEGPPLPEQSGRADGVKLDPQTYTLVLETSLSIIGTVERERQQQSW